ncbi:hypothetical protein LINPERPRIM_LOCUS16265 [Linum perenne]
MPFGYIGGDHIGSESGGGQSYSYTPPPTPVRRNYENAQVTTMVWDESGAPDNSLLERMANFGIGGKRSEMEAKKKKKKSSGTIRPALPPAITPRAVIRRYLNEEGRLVVKAAFDPPRNGTGFGADDDQEDYVFLDLNSEENET